MHIKNHTSSLLELIRYANKDKTLELEARLKKTQNNQITSEVFFNVMKRLKGTPGVSLTNETTDLDIGLTGDYNNIRVTVAGDQSITEYCKKNEIKLVSNGTVSYMKKTPIRNVDINEYNLRFNLKREVELLNTDVDIINIIKGWTNLDKTFRYKKRFTFHTADGLFRFDLTTVKTSQKKMVKGKNTKMKKKDIKPYMKKYVVKPSYVVDVNSWLEKQDDNSMIEMKGRSYPELIYFKSLQKSNVLKNDLEYEIEVEYLGNKSGTKGRIDDQTILGQFMQKLIIILQAVQKSYYIISELERLEVTNQYKTLMGDYRFNAPMTVSLTLSDVLEKNYEEYKNSVSIRRGYSVTDKADGERNLLIVLEDGSLFILNRKNFLRKLNAKCPGLKNSIFDVEYLMRDKMGNNVNMIMIFDVYFVNSEDVRGRIFNRTEAEVKKGIIEQSRYEIIVEKMPEFESNIEKSDKNNLEITKKRFFFGDDDVFDESTLLSINSIKSSMHDMDPESEEYAQNKEQLSVLKADNRIFKEAAKVYNKEYPYHIDGLIFTPRSLAVGEEPDKEKRNPANGRWYRCFKWKPPEENTIDFLGVFKKEGDTKSYQTKYVTVNGKVIECRILVLHVGYNPIQHTRYNSFKVLNENVTFEPGYNPTPFVPTEPYIKDVHLCYMPVENGNCYTEDRNIISDNSIIEFSFNKSKEVGFCWSPMRIRDTLKPNDFITANNVWNSIFNPVTTEMIISGSVPVKASKYFDNKTKRSDKKSKAMNDFHSFMKKKLLIENLGGKKQLLDLGVGKAGDLNHWIEAGCNMVVGIDTIKDNLDNPQDGACNRLLSRYSQTNSVTVKKSKDGDVKSLLDNTLMIWGDCSKNILDSSAAKDDLSKYYLDVLYGRIPESSILNSKIKGFHNVGGTFDLVISNFAIHYFFENETTLRNVVNNISKSLRPGGKFVCTTLNGQSVFDKLKYTNVAQSFNNSWRITKKYSQETFPATAKSLGYRIEVYVESIGQSIDEFLVHPDYFEEILSDYGLKLITKGDFSEHFERQSETNKIYGDMLKMEPDLQTYSFLNMYMILEKTEDV
jgi:SAM-dependent methyltransferase